MSPVLSQGNEPGTGRSEHRSPLWVEPFGTSRCLTQLPHFPRMSAHFLFPASFLYEHLPAKSIKKKKKEKTLLPSLNESWEPFNANVKHIGAAKVSRGKIGKEGSKGYPLRVNSEVGGTQLLWDKTHLHKPKKKKNRALLYTSEKKTRCERQKRTQRTIKEIFVGVLPFPLVAKGVRMYKCITQKRQEFTFKFKWSFNKFCRDCLRIYAYVPQGTKILLYEQMKYLLSIFLHIWCGGHLSYSYSLPPPPSSMFLFLWNSSAKYQESSGGASPLVYKWSDKEISWKTWITFQGFSKFLTYCSCKTGKKKFFPIAQEIQTFCLLHS